MQPRPCLIGLDKPEVRQLAERLPMRVTACEMPPRIVVRDGRLFVEPPVGAGLAPASAVVYHGIFADDLALISGLALWGGPCLPAAAAMMDCRLKLPCLVRALRYTRFGAPPRGFASAGAEFDTQIERVAKWGDWHCGENKARFDRAWRGDEPAIVEPFLEGEAVRVVLIGDRHWQIKLAGDAWLKSIHHADARLMEADERLTADSRRIAQGFGLSILANDYVIDRNGEPHLLEVNHIPNVTRFPEIWSAYADHVVDWLTQQESR